MLRPESKNKLWCECTCTSCSCLPAYKTVCRMANINSLGYIQNQWHRDFKYWNELPGTPMISVKFTRLSGIPQFLPGWLQETVINRCQLRLRVTAISNCHIFSVWFLLAFCEVERKGKSPHDTLPQSSLSDHNTARNHLHDQTHIFFFLGGGFKLETVILP